METAVCCAIVARARRVATWPSRRRGVIGAERGFHQRSFLAKASPRQRPGSAWPPLPRWTKGITPLPTLALSALISKPSPPGLLENVFDFWLVLGPVTLQAEYAKLMAGFLAWTTRTL